MPTESSTVRCMPVLLLGLGKLLSIMEGNVTSDKQIRPQFFFIWCEEYFSPEFELRISCLMVRRSGFFPCGEFSVPQTANLSLIQQVSNRIIHVWYQVGICMEIDYLNHHCSGLPTFPFWQLQICCRCNSLNFELQVAQYASDSGNGKTAFQSVDQCIRYYFSQQPG